MSPFEYLGPQNKQGSLCLFILIGEQMAREAFLCPESLLSKKLYSLQKKYAHSILGGSSLETSSESWDD